MTEPMAALVLRAGSAPLVVPRGTTARVPVVSRAGGTDG